MADFNKAYDITMGHEGNYVNDSDDRGGETYKGIARNFWPNWAGWAIIDMLKIVKDFPAPLKNNDKLQQYVRDFYKEHFWDVNKLDWCKSQIVAEEIFDTGVNMGVGKAAKFFQETLNILNRNGYLFEDLEVDGKLGPKTYSAFDILYKNGEEDLVYKILNILQGYRYIEIMQSNPTQEKFARGWLARVTIQK